MARNGGSLPRGVATVIRNLPMFCFLPLACLAQYEYVTTDDGSKLFFTSSERLAGTNQSFRSKLFSWDARHGVQLVYDPVTESVGHIGITGDGSLAAVALYPDTSPRSRGAVVHVDTGQIEPVGAMAIISRNGRYLFNGDALIDRIAGISRPVSIGGSIEAFVGSDGSLLYREPRNLHRIDPNGTDRTVTNGLRFGHLYAADDNTTTAIISVDSVLPNVVVNTITGRQVSLDTPGLRYSAPAFLSGDGQWVTVEAKLRPNYRTQIMLCRADASGCKFLTSAANEASPIAISGDAGAVYSYQMRIETSTGRTEPTFVLAPTLSLANPPVVPGSLVRLESSTAVDHIGVNGRAAPLLSPPGVFPVIQIPWDLPDTTVQFTIDGGDSPFEIPSRVYPVSDFFRVFDPACASGNFLVIAYKQMRCIEAETNRRRGEPDLRTEIPVTNFRGIELRDFPAESARLALVIAAYQSDVLYRGPLVALAEFLPLDAMNWISCGNALRLDWLSICPPTGSSVKLLADDLFSTPLDQAQIDSRTREARRIFAAPPYKGSQTQTKEQ